MQSSLLEGTLWLHALSEVGARSAHVIRNRLNGVAVNLEVVRSRVARADESLARFAEAAASNLEAASAVTAALLSFMRPEGQPADVRDIALRVARVVPGVEVSADANVAPAQTTVSPVVARIIIVRAILDALAPEARVECAISGHDDIFLAVRPSSSVQSATAAGALNLDPRVTALAAQHGVEILIDRAGIGSIRIAFPASPKHP
jgi:hypothetical protein